MNKGRVVFERLHQIGCYGILQQHRHRPGGFEIGGAHRFAPACLADDNVREAATQILQIGRKTENRHYFRSDNDVEAVLARKAIGDPAERRDDRTQRAVVHVDAAPPSDPARINVEFVAPIDVVVDHCAEQIVGRADRVKVAGKMEIDVLHRHDLGIAAAGSTPLHAKARPEARLAQAQDRLFADVVEGIAQPDGGRCLALAGRRRGDRGHQNQLAVRPVAQRVDVIKRNLRLVPSIGRYRVIGNTELAAGDFADRLHRCGLRDLDIGFRVFVLVFSARHGLLSLAECWTVLAPSQARAQSSELTIERWLQDGSARERFHLHRRESPTRPDYDAPARSAGC